MRKELVLLSGGLDSSTALALSVYRNKAQNTGALNMYYGQRHEKEILCARQIAKHYGVEYIEMDISSIMAFSNSSMLANSDKDVPVGDYASQIEKNGVVSTYVPFRNGILLSIAASIAYAKGYDAVVYGAHKDDTAAAAYPDCTETFAYYMGMAIKEGTSQKICVVAPFIEYTKADIVRLGLQLKVPYEKTWSCYAGGEKPCGKCATCIDRQKAFEANEKEDPLCSTS